jgi:hypothetical protein
MTTPTLIELRKLAEAAKGAKLPYSGDAKKAILAFQCEAVPSRVIELLDALEAQAAEIERLTQDRDDIWEEKKRLSKLLATTKAELAALKAQEPVGFVESAVRGAGGFHARLHEGVFMPAGTALYASPVAQEVVSLKDAMFDEAVSWCDSSGINVLGPEQLSSLVNTLYLTAQEVGREEVAFVKFKNGAVDFDTDDNIVISNMPGDCMDESIEWKPVYLSAHTPQKGER